MTSADLVYQVLKVIEQGKEPKALELGVDSEDFKVVMEQVHDSNFATNIAFSRGGRGNPIRTVHANGSELTTLGLKFISEYEARIKANS
ncbi:MULTISPECIES: hypothetical protein [unclassified Paenibacillus]|uniref:hypothetical protein n=1 Tax=unclassified Paenibacillus TaxID=185978 RepID=UPI000467D553|nr:MULTISPECIES: hypothetical protein [unclassified Paenibacillus]KGP80104.1 hypothetical protein P364_0122150 [Paenibacillus sp. MAEPY2]KGP89395.1 hypothetical protein P363_0100140 [Paenibacillus sp. MAEPY1]